MVRSFFFVLLLLLGVAADAARADIVVDTFHPGFFTFAENDEVFRLLPGGAIEDKLSFGGARNRIFILGGSIGAEMTFSGFDDVIRISGGSIADGISFSGLRHVFHISGGDVGPTLGGSGVDHVFNFYGTGLVLSDVDPFTKRLVGNLLDGTAIDLEIQTGAFVNPTFALNPSPEPGTAFLLAAGLCAGAWVRRRRRQRA